MISASIGSCTITTGTHNTAFHAAHLRDACQTGSPYTPEAFTHHHTICPYEHVIVLEQQHGIDGITITDDDDPYQYQPYQVCGDYSITTHRNIACAIVTADCVPIILYEPTTQCIAAIHAGWRGLAQGVIDVVMHQMRCITQTDMSSAYAYIGPCARACCYTVDTPVYHALHQQTQNSSSWSTSTRSGYQIDLMQCTYTQITHHMLPERHIWCTNICTICDEHMYSFRADQTPYRHITCAMLW